MKQAVNAADIDERAEVGDAAHDAFDDFVFLQLAPQFGLALFAIFRRSDAMRRDHFIALAVDFDDAHRNRAPDETAQIAAIARIDVARRHERRNAQIDDQAAFHLLAHDAFEVGVFVFRLLDGAPGFFVIGAALGENRMAFVVFGTQHHDFDFIADGNLVAHFVARHDAFAFGADIDQRLAGVFIDAHHDAHQKRATLQRIDAAHVGAELVHFHDLRHRRLLGRSGGFRFRGRRSFRRAVAGGRTAGGGSAGGGLRRIALRHLRRGRHAGVNCLRGVGALLRVVGVGVGQSSGIDGASGVSGAGVTAVSEVRIGGRWRFSSLRIRRLRFDCRRGFSDRRGVGRGGFVFVHRAVVRRGVFHRNLLDALVVSARRSLASTRVIAGLAAIGQERVFHKIMVDIVAMQRNTRIGVRPVETKAGLRKRSCD